MAPVQKLTYLLFLGLVFSYPGQNFFQRLHLTPRPPKVQTTYIALAPVDLPTAEKLVPTWASAQAAVVIDPDSGTVLFAKNPHTPLHPASTTKIMTALVALDSYRLTDILTVKT